MKTSDYTYSLVGNIRDKTYHHMLGSVVMVLLTIQFSTFTLMRAHAHLKDSDTVIMLYSEIIKLIISICSSFKHCKYYLKDIQYAIFPFLCFCAMNLISLKCLRVVNATTYVIIMQTKIAWTAVFARIILKKYISILQAIMLLSILNGIMSVVYQQHEVDGSTSNEYAILGLVIETILSGISTNYIQLSFKESVTNVWIRNVQLSALSIILYASIGFVNESHFEISIMGAITSLLSASGGILVALTLFYSGSIEKTISNASSVAFTLLTESIYFENKYNVNIFNCIGVLLSSSIYYLYIR